MSNFHFPISTTRRKEEEGGRRVWFLIERASLVSLERKSSLYPESCTLVFPGKWKWKEGEEGVVRVNCEHADVTISRVGGGEGNRAAHCIKVYHLRFFLIIIAFVDNGPGIICYREMSWSRNFLNYFGSQLPFPSGPRLSSSSFSSSPPPFRPPFFSRR